MMMTAAGKEEDKCIKIANKKLQFVNCSFFIAGKMLVPVIFFHL